MNVGIYSVYSKDINEYIPYYQKQVFDKFQINIQHRGFGRCNFDLKFHPDALMEVIKTSKEDYLIFFDVDCIPLSPLFYQKMIDDIKDDNTLSGIVQCANHVSNIDPYVGPGFFGFSKQLYLDCGSPDLTHVIDISDVNQPFSIKCKEMGKRIRYWMVTDPGDSIWHISQMNLMFGHGTVYENMIYHQFEIRFKEQHNMFIEKCKAVLNQ